MRGLGISGYPSFSTQNQGFFQRHMRRISSSLPRFSHYAQDAPYAEKEKLGRGRWQPQRIPLVGRLVGAWARMGRRPKSRLILLFLLLFSIWFFYHTRKVPRLLLSREACALTLSTALVYYWRRTLWLGGGQKYVIVLAANVGGGVMEWKGAREWAIERDSVRNKRKYVARWGYDLEIVDMSTKKRYAHEWREGWEKADYIRNTFRKYPKAEW